jgi:hypothetical protein
LEKKTIKYKPVYKLISVKTVDGSVIQGKVNIAGKERVSEIFTGSDKPFIVMIDVKLKSGLAGKLFINKQHIVWVEPRDMVREKKLSPNF